MDIIEALFSSAPIDTNEDTINKIRVCCLIVSNVNNRVGPLLIDRSQPPVVGSLSIKNINQVWIGGSPNLANKAKFHTLFEETRRLITINQLKTS